MTITRQRGWLLSGAAGLGVLAGLAITWHLTANFAAPSAPVPVPALAQEFGEDAMEAPFLSPPAFWEDGVPDVDDRRVPTLAELHERLQLAVPGFDAAVVAPPPAAAPTDPDVGRQLRELLDEHERVRQAMAKHPAPLFPANGPPRMDAGDTSPDGLNAPPPPPLPGGAREAQVDPPPIEDPLLDRLPGPATAVSE